MYHSVQMRSSSLLLELRIVPESTDVSPMRRLVEETIGRVWGDNDAVCRIAIAAHELLENAAKYSSGGQTTLRIALERMEGFSVVSVTLSNETTPEHMERVRSILNEMLTTDPFVFYQTLMRRNAQQSHVSSLGLARIRAECDMKISYGIENSRLSITARSEIPTRSAA